MTTNVEHITEALKRIERQNELLQAAICGSLEKQTPGLLGKMRIIEERCARREGDSALMARRVAACETTIDGNGTPGLRHSVVRLEETHRQFRVTFRRVGIIVCMVVLIPVLQALAAGRRPTTQDVARAALVLLKQDAQSQTVGEWVADRPDASDNNAIPAER